MMAIQPLIAADAATVQEMVLEFGAYLTALGDSWRHNFTAERYLADGFGPTPLSAASWPRRMAKHWAIC